MEWDASTERLANLRRSIRPILTDIPLRQVLAEDFPQDCAGLPISGGWGYTQADAIIFVRHQFPRPAAPEFVRLEYHVAQKIVYEELIIFRARGGAQHRVSLRLCKGYGPVGRIYLCSHSTVDFMSRQSLPNSS
jgi:hypothetical protein